MIISFEIKGNLCLIDSNDVDLLLFYWGLKKTKDSDLLYLQKQKRMMG